MKFLFLCNNSKCIEDPSRCSKLVAKLSELSVVTVVSLSFSTLDGPKQLLDLNSITSLTASRSRSLG